MLDAVENRRRITELAGGREISADTLLKDFGFTGDKLTARLADLSGGERRRLQFLRLLLDEPNVLLLDEPTNDLDIDTLTVIEDYLDGWPGTLIVVTHDRYFLERVTDVTYALTGGGRCDLLPGGIEQYLADRAAATEAASAAGPSRTESASARERRTGKEMARIEGQLPSSTTGSPPCTRRWRTRRRTTCGWASSTLNSRTAGAQGISRRSLAGRGRGNHHVVRGGSEYRPKWVVSAYRILERRRGARIRRGWAINWPAHGARESHRRSPGVIRSPSHVSSAPGRPHASRPICAMLKPANHASPGWSARGDGGRAHVLDL